MCSNFCWENSRRSRVSVACSCQASNYKIHVTRLLFSGSSGRVSVPCPRVCTAETSNIPILFGHGQKYTLTYTAWAHSVRHSGQIASVILLLLLFFLSKSTTKRSLYSNVCHIYRIYKNAKKGKNINHKWKHLRAKIKKTTTMEFSSPKQRFQTVAAEQTYAIWGQCIPLTSGCTGSSLPSPPSWNPHTWARRQWRLSSRWWLTPHWSVSTYGTASGSGCTAEWVLVSGSSLRRPGQDIQHYHHIKGLALSATINGIWINW